MKNDPKKKVSKCVWGYFWGVFMMFSDGVDAFWDLTAQNLFFFGSSVANSPCTTFRSQENLAETASTGPQTQFFGILAKTGKSSGY